jgi:hypothetical protein
MVRQAEAVGLDAGARAFVAREGAAIASALDRAATALRAGATARDPLQLVLRALQPLRGLAALNDLPPLPEVLEGIERAITEVNRTSPAPAAAPDFFQGAATAIAQAAREVAERGRPDPEGPAFRAFAGQLGRFFDREPVVIPISDLYFDDGGPHIVQRGAGAAQAGPLSRVELVSHGEHLRLAADAIERAPSPTQRELRVHTLAGTFRALAVAGEGQLPKSLGRFVDAAREAVALGHAMQEPAGFAAALRGAGELLASAASADETRLAAGLLDVAGQLHALAAPVPPPPAPTFAPVAPPITPPIAAAPAAQPPGEDLAAPIFAIEDLAPAVARGPRKPPMPPLTLTERSEVPAETPDLVGSWIAYERMVAHGIGPASLEVLMGAAEQPAWPSLDTARPSPPVAQSAPAFPVPAPLEELPIVDVQSLLYRGDRALARVQELRALARQLPPAELPGLFDEVCDLVDLARATGP